MKRAFSLNDLTKSGKYLFRYCTASIEFDSSITTKQARFFSYSTQIIHVIFKDGYICYMRVRPYKSMTTWAHVRKFLTMFKNGRDAYAAYKNAAKHGGIHTFEF